MNETLVACTALTKRYGNKTALRGVDRLVRQHGVLRLSGDAQLAFPVGDHHVKFRLDEPDVLIEGAEQVRGLLQTLDLYPLFH